MVNNSTDERGEKMLRKTCLQELFLLCYLQVVVIGCKSKNYPPQWGVCEGGIHKNVCFFVKKCNFICVIEKIVVILQPDLLCGVTSCAKNRQKNNKLTIIY